MPWWQQLGARAINMAAPGTPFNTRASNFGSAWRTGDWNRAAQGDKYAIGRTAASFLPFGGLLGAGLSAAERSGINRREYQPDFVGPPRYSSGRSNQLLRMSGTPRSMQQVGPDEYIYRNPNEVGPPAPKPESTKPAEEVADTGRRSSNTRANRRIDRAASMGTNLLAPNPGRSESSAARGFGWQGTTNVGDTLAALSTFGNIGNENRYGMQWWPAAD